MYTCLYHSTKRKGRKGRLFGPFFVEIGRPPFRCGLEYSKELGGFFSIWCVRKYRQHASMKLMKCKHAFAKCCLLKCQGISTANKNISVLCNLTKSEIWPVNKIFNCGGFIPHTTSKLNSYF